MPDKRPGIERRFVELRNTEGRVLEGIAVRYGDVALNPLGQRERFSPGALEYQDVILNVQHERGRPIARTEGGGLELTDTDTELSVRAELPATREADDALELVRKKILRGLSVEFRALEEIIEGSVRVIKKARLLGIGLVDRPAYPQSLVTTRAKRGSVRGSVPFSGGRCDCQGGDCTGVRYEGKESFEQAIRDNDILLYLGSYDAPLASSKSGTLRLELRDDGLKLIADLPDTPDGIKAAELLKTVKLNVRPYSRVSTSEGKLIDSILVFERADLMGLGLTASPAAREGWEEAEFVEPETPRKRRRLWL